jgi:hypothetical protein
MREGLKAIVGLEGHRNIFFYWGSKYVLTNKMVYIDIL